MRRALAIILVLTSQVTGFGQSQADKLVGRWSGTVQSFQGQQPAAASFKKDGQALTGTISGMRPGMEIAVKDVKVDGDKITAKSELETPQGSIVVNYQFTLDGDTLKGTGEVDFNGQTFGFNFDLKRGEAAAGQQPPGGQQPQPRPQVPQPQQKQSINYFVGQWSFKWIGRESPLGPAPREGTFTVVLRPDGKTADAKTDAKSDSVPYKETAVLSFDDETKTLNMSERLANGIQLQSKGDWRSPISIRFTVEPIKVKGQTLMLKRTIAVVAAHSFTVTEELSEDGGPFVRLGSAIYSRVSESK